MPRFKLPKRKKGKKDKAKERSASVDHLQSTDRDEEQARIRSAARGARSASVDYCLEGDEESLPPSLRMASGVPNYKVILCGEYGVGKSSIFRRFLNNTFTDDNSKKSTVGLDQCTRPFLIGKTAVKLTLWDTGGMERMSFIGSSYYRGAHAALLCYNSNNKDTFTILSQYILDIVMNAEGARIFLCSNMADGEGKDPVEEADLDVFMSECEDVLSGVYNISCKDNWGLGEMFEDMAHVLHTEAMNRMTIRRDLIRPGETPEFDDESQEKKRCC